MLGIGGAVNAPEPGGEPNSAGDRVKLRRGESLVSQNQIGANHSGHLCVSGSGKTGLEEPGRLSPIEIVSNPLGQ